MSKYIYTHLSIYLYLYISTLLFHSFDLYSMEYLGSKLEVANEHEKRCDVEKVEETSEIEDVFDDPRQKEQKNKN